MNREDYKGLKENFVLLGVFGVLGVFGLLGGFGFYKFYEEKTSVLLGRNGNLVKTNAAFSLDHREDFC